MLSDENPASTPDFHASPASLLVPACQVAASSQAGSSDAPPRPVNMVASTAHITFYPSPVPETLCTDMRAEGTHTSPGVKRPREDGADQHCIPQEPATLPPRKQPLTPLNAAPGKVPIQIARKTPISTPMSSGRATPLSNSSSSIFASAEPSLPSSRPGTPSAVDAFAKVQQRHQKWASLLTPALMMGRQVYEKETVSAVCMRIAASIPGDAQEAKDTLLMLYSNLKDPKNGALRDSIISGTLPVEVVVTLGERDLVNPERRRQLDEEFEERAKDTNLEEIQKAQQTTSRLFPCPACKARDCTWYQKQTRSADEPMTVFCTCNKCRHMWKRF